MSTGTEVSGNQHAKNGRPGREKTQRTSGSTTFTETSCYVRKIPPFLFKPLLVDCSQKGF